MGCICATARSPNAAVANNELLDSSKSILHLIPHPPSSSSSSSKKEGSFTRPTSAASITVVANGYPVVRRPSTSSDRNSNKPVVIVGAPTRNHTRRVTAMPAVQPMQQQPGRLTGNKTELTNAEWPSWLASVAGEAIKGWAPRCADSYEKLDKVS